MHEFSIHKNEAELNQYNYSLPQRINTPYPHVASGDLLEILRKVNSTISGSDVFSFQKKIFLLQEAYMPEDSTFYSYTVGSLSAKVEERMKKYKEESERKVGFAIIDRSIGSNFTNEEVFRLQISRGNNNDIIARSSEALSPERQMDQLAQWVTQNNIQDVQVVDDILAFGQTLVPVVNGVRERLQDVSLGIQVGLTASGGEWRGYEVLQEKANIVPKYITLINASPANPKSIGMSIPTSKAMTVFGGYRDSAASIDRPISFPHLLPFTIPKTAFFDINKRVEASEKLLDFSDELISFIESRNRSPFRIGDLVKHGFGIPYTTIDKIKDKFPLPDFSVTVKDYLLQIKDVLYTQQTLIFEELEKSNELERQKYIKNQ